MYSINCYVDKVIVGENGVEAIKIKPVGRSRVEGEDTRCLGFDCEDKDNNKVSWFPLEVHASNKLRDVILMARISGKEVELRVEENGGQEGSPVKTIVI